MFRNVTVTAEYFFYYPTFSDILYLRKTSGLITFNPSTSAISQERVDFPANIIFFMMQTLLHLPEVQITFTSYSTYAVHGRLLE